MLRGLQASGKSTWAKKMAREHGFKVVNKDQLRAMLDDGQWSKDNERLIVKLRDEIIASCLSIGKSVIVDDTNFNSSHEKTLKHLAKVWDATFEINDSFLSVSLEECIDRDSKRPNPVGEKVIRDTYDRYLKSGNIVQQDLSAPRFDESLPKAIIVDIDGTLAHCNDRNVYDYSKVISDELDEMVYEVVSMLSLKYKIVIVSGRDGACRKETEEWLKKHSVHYDDFFMRPAGNTENDAVIKKRILVNDIMPKYFPILAVDDRDRVVRMWRDSGLKCFQVADGNF